MLIVGFQIKYNWELRQKQQKKSTKKLSYAKLVPIKTAILAFFIANRFLNVIYVNQKRLSFRLLLLFVWKTYYKMATTFRFVM